MRGAFVVAMVPQLAACAIGAGSAYVGQWRPHDQVEYDACLVDDAGGCVDRKQVVSHVPARRFWGVIVAYPAVGAASVTQDGQTATHVRLEPSLEILRGEGPVAFGVRTSVTMDVGGATTVPVVAIGHLSLTERLSVHAGAGYSPYSRLGMETSLVGARGLVGAELALGRTRSETFIVLGLEADTMWIDFDHRYRANGITGHLGIYF